MPDFKHFEVVDIIDSGTNVNQFSGKNEKWFSVQVQEIQGDEKVNGRKVFGGKTIGKTFLEKQEGGWVRLLSRVADPDDNFHYEDLPVFKAFIHECKTPPYYVRRKDANGKLVYAKYETKDHEDFGQFVVSNKFRLLLGADEDEEIAVSDFLGKQKMVNLATVDETIKKYIIGGKAYNLLSMTNDDTEINSNEESVTNTTKPDTDNKDDSPF